MNFEFKNPSRRDLMRQLMSLGAVAPLAVPLQAMGAAVSNPTDYKALVCIYLAGGNDHWNTLTPLDPDSYKNYAKYRGDLATDSAKLLELKPITDQKGRRAGLHPKLPFLKKLWDEKNLAIIPAIGPMNEPITRAEIANGTKIKPAAVGSHNDGESQWHTLGLEGSRYGWGGRLMDLLKSSNSSSLFSSVAAGLYSPWGSGQTTQQFQISGSGIAVNLAGIEGASLYQSTSAPAELRKLYTSASSNLLEAAYLDVAQRVTKGSDIAKKAFANTSSFTAYPNRKAFLGNALQSIARLIDQRDLLQAKRQIFYVDLRGFDLHSGLLQLHPELLGELNDALAHFFGLLKEKSLSDKVVTFTTTEFGRKIIANGDGTDHAWSGTAFVMGDAVNGGDYYGKLPVVDVNGPDFFADPTDKVDIPQYAVEQYGATLAKWFGVSNTDLSVLFPRLKRFSPETLPFL